MAEVSVRVNGRLYSVGCEDGQEQHVLGLARLFDQHVTQVAGEVGQLGETRLFLLGALLLADELAETRDDLAAAGSGLAQARSDREQLESRAAEALDTAAARIEALAAKAV